MNFGKIKDVVTSKAARQVLTLQKHSPTILFAAGIVGVVGTVVLASRATLKVESVLDEHNETLEKINTTEIVGYTEDDKKQDTLVLYVQTAGKFAKLYAPAVLVGALAVTCLTGSHYILTQRNAGLMAAYAALDKGFRAYRERVRADVGEEKEREYRYGAEKITVEETDAKGKIIKKQDVVRVAGEPSIYAKLWGQDYSSSWNPVPDYNLVFLRSQQNYLNDLLKARGHVYLNEAYDQLGLPHTKEGAVVGWIYDEKNPDIDNYIDLGLFNRNMEPQHFDFFTGREDAIWLDFNVDGVMYDKI